jgi:hypothetical protein
MEFKKYQHIEKTQSSEVEGILNGEVHLFYKIDGTNSCVWLKEDGNLGFGSRNRELSLDNDNAGFMNEIKKDLDIYNALLKYLNNHPKHIIYGEWLVPHTLKTYTSDSWRKFYIFDIYDTATESYINYDIYSKLIDYHYPALNYIPLITKLTNPTEDDIKSYLEKTGQFLISEGLGEGIVIKNYNYRNRWGHIKWAKMLTEDFRNNKQHTRQFASENKEDNPIEYKIIKLMTIEHIQKEYHKLVEAKGEFNSKMIFELLNRVFNEFFRDNWEIILKKFKNPTIDFRKLKQLSDIKTKEVLSL